MLIRVQPRPQKNLIWSRKALKTLRDFSFLEIDSLPFSRKDYGRIEIFGDIFRESPERGSSYYGVTLIC